MLVNKGELFDGGIYNSLMNSHYKEVNIEAALKLFSDNSLSRNEIGFE